MSDQRAGRPGLHRLMYGLLYPAVLGTVFVLFVQDDLLRFQMYPRALFAVVFLFHWCAEFILATARGQEDTYTTPQFVGGTALVIAMYMAFVTLPSFGEHSPSYAHFYASVGVIGLAFLGTDGWRRWREGYHPDRCLVVVDTALLLNAVLFFAFHELVPAVHGNAGIAYLFILITLAASVISLFCRVGRR